MARRTRQQPREQVVWQQDEKRVIRADGEYRAEIAGMVIGWFDCQHDAEQAANAELYQALARKAA